MTVALVIQHSMRIRHIVLSSVAYLALPYLSTLSHQRHDFRKKKGIKQEMCVTIYSTNFVWNICQPKKNSSRYYHKCTQVFIQGIFLSCQILMKLEFSRQIFEKMLKCKISWKSVRWDPSFFSPCGWTDGQRKTEKHDEANRIALRKLANAPRTDQ